MVIVRILKIVELTENTNKLPELAMCCLYFHYHHTKIYIEIDIHIHRNRYIYIIDTQIHIHRNRYTKYVLALNIIYFIKI